MSMGLGLHVSDSFEPIKAEKWCADKTFLWLDGRKSENCQRQNSFGGFRNKKAYGFRKAHFCSAVLLQDAEDAGAGGTRA